MAGKWGYTDKGKLVNCRDKRSASSAESVDNLHQIGIVSTLSQCCVDDGDIEFRRPHRMLGYFQHQRVAGVDGRNNLSQHVVKRIVPRNNRTEHAVRLVFHPRCFVHREHSNIAKLRLQHPLAVRQRPADLLARRKHFSKRSIHHCEHHNIHVDSCHYKQKCAELQNIIVI